MEHDIGSPPVRWLLAATCGLMLLVTACGAANYFALQCFGTLSLLTEGEEESGDGAPADIARIGAWTPSAVTYWLYVGGGLFGCGMATIASAGALVLACIGIGWMMATTVHCAARIISRAVLYCQSAIVASRARRAQAKLRDVAFASPYDCVGAMARNVASRQAGDFASSTPCSIGTREDSISDHDPFDMSFSPSRLEPHDHLCSTPTITARVMTAMIHNRV